MAANDRMSSSSGGVEAPGTGVEAVTLSNTQELVNVSRGLYVGGGGDVSVLMLDGSTGTFIGVVAGTILPIRVRRVNLTGTTASNMTSIY
jgi:hypothetical protein